MRFWWGRQPDACFCCQCHHCHYVSVRLLAKLRSTKERHNTLHNATQVHVQYVMDPPSLHTHKPSLTHTFQTTIFALSLSLSLTHTHTHAPPPPNTHTQTRILDSKYFCSLSPSVCLSVCLSVSVLSVCLSVSLSLSLTHTHTNTPLAHEKHECHSVSSTLF